jgi:hypothetical protein
MARCSTRPTPSSGAAACTATDAAGSGPPDDGGARMRRTVPVARLPAPGGVHRPPDSLDPLRSRGIGCAWRWIAVSPTGSAEPPSPPTPRPSPPSAKEAACLLEEAWKDEVRGTLIWLAMTTGARRGSCARFGDVTSTSRKPCSRSSRAWRTRARACARRTRRPTRSARSSWMRAPLPFWRIT